MAESLNAEHPPPQNLAAEETVLGAILLAGAMGAEASTATIAAVRRPASAPRTSTASARARLRGGARPRGAGRADRRARGSRPSFAAWRLDRIRAARADL